MKAKEDYEFANVTDHAFLPRKIRPVECKAAEVALVAQLSEFLSNRPKEKAFHSMVTDWLKWMQTPPLCQQLLDALSKSLPVAVPLLDHNAIVLFTQGNSPDNILVSAIDIWPHDSSIHSKSNDNKLLPSDCRLAVPRYSGIVHRSQVVSIVFLEQLSALSNSQWSFPERNPETTQAFHTVTDTRKPANPVYIFEWLMATLQQLPLDMMHSNVQHRVLFKRVRLESIRKNAYDNPWTRSSAWVALKSALHVAMIQMDGFDTGGCRYKFMMAEFKASLVRLALKHYLEHQNGDGYLFGDIVELNAHLARTAGKLQQFSLASKTLEKIRRTTEQVESALNLDWQGFLKKEETEQNINLQSLMPYVASPSCDAPNLMKQAKTALSQALVTDNVLESMRSSKTQQKTIPPDHQVYHSSSSDATFDRLMKEINSSVTSPDDMERALQAVEIFIRIRLWPNRSSGLLTDSLEVQVAQGSSLLKAYHTAASIRYKNTAIRLSKMILYSHALLAWIDSLCVRWDELGIVGQHQLFGVDPAELKGLLLMNASDLDLLHELCDYLRIRMDSKLKPSIADVSASSLAFRYVIHSGTMMNYEAQYQIEVEQFTKAKIAELDRVNEEYKNLGEKMDQLVSVVCQCKKEFDMYKGKYNTIPCSKCSLKKQMLELEKSVSIYERRLPDDEVARLCVIFHSKLIPDVLRNYRESCAFLVDVCLSETTANSWDQLESKPFRWSSETPFTFQMALGSNTKPMAKTHYGKRISILQSKSDFLLPQRKNVLMGIKVKGTYRYLGTPKWDLTPYCQIPITNPYGALKFTVYDVQHSENDVLVLQCHCPAELQLVAFKDFGTLRAGGGYLQWRNIAAALESGILDLCDHSVVALLLTAAYQVGPLPATDNWNYDLTESAFVEEMCQCVQLVMDRIEPSWNSSRALYLCICLLSYVADHTTNELSEQPLSLLSRCRKICIKWSDSIEKTLSINSKGDTGTTARNLYFVNGLAVLTFGAERSTLSDDVSLFEFLRARTIMFEQNLVKNKDAELDHLSALCIRTSARHQPFIHEQIATLNFQALNQLVFDRWAPKKITEWSRCLSSDASEGIQGKKSRKKGKKVGKGLPWEIVGNHLVPSDYYRADCIAKDDTYSIVHIDVVEGTFLVDGEPAGRLPHAILHHELFQRDFPDASSLAVYHRGGGVFETKGTLKIGAKFTFAMKDFRELIIREIDCDGVARRLLPWQSFNDELPQSLVEDHTHWMTYNIPGKYIIELRPKNTHDLHPTYKIELDAQLRGQVIHCETSRKMLNFTGEVFDHIYRTVGWRLDQKRFIEPYWSTKTENDDEELSDNWSVCLYYPRLHLHMEIHVDLNKIKVTVLEYENMVVSSSQYLGSFIGLNQMLVLERRNGLRTVIVPHFGFRAVKHGKHHRLEIAEENVNKYQNLKLCSEAVHHLLDSKYTSFTFDEDRSLGQMRPNGEETYEKWLMCAYLHGATCSAMAEPLTGLTGLEMALTQLRRCRVNKPLSEASLSILNRIEELAVKRGGIYDSLTVNWPDVYSSYSISDAYIPLIQLIKTKSKNLRELYEARPQQQGKYFTTSVGQKKREEDLSTEKLELIKHAYSRYEFVYSPAAQLDSREKMKLKIALEEEPIVPFTSNVLPNTLTFKVIHAGICKAALEDEIVNGNFSWITFIKEFDFISPVFGLDQLLHVGHWSQLCFSDGSMWLTLFAKAILCHSTTVNDRALCLKRFTQMLSFAAWKLSNLKRRAPVGCKHDPSTYITALGKLLKLALSSNDSRVTLKLPSIEHLPLVRVELLGQRFLDEKKIDFSSAVSIYGGTFEKLSEHWSSTKDVRSHLNAIIWESVKHVEVWKTENSNVIAITTGRTPVKGAFLGITNSLPVQIMEWEKSKIVELAQEYYEKLFYRQQLYNFFSLLDQENDCINRVATQAVQNCRWHCLSVPSLKVALFEKTTTKNSSINDCSTESFESMCIKDETGNGQCPELEELFLYCLIKEASTERKVEEFPLQLGDKFEKSPISTDIVFKLRHSWKQHQKTIKNTTHFQPIQDIQQILKLIWEYAQNLCNQSWADVIRYYKEQEEDVLSRIKSAARISSPLAPRILFPLYGRGNLPVTARCLVEKHLIYQVYAQKAQRCLLLLDVTENVAGEEDRRHSVVRLVAEISESHCSGGGWTPQQYPKWLLFEVENNIIIRKKQVLVANAILADNKKIFQLNMGEGKTSVITPLVCTALATTNSVVRITLLTSLLETHGQELALRLGGILEHSVYYFPCSREVTFNESLVNKMITQFNECLEEGGSIVTVPEHRLSMMHKFDELCIRYHDGTGTIPSTAATFLNVLNLSRRHVVDIVDEADEILRHKYQLLYTIGVQEAVDGGERRWKVVQQVLQILRDKIGAFCEKHVEELRDNIVHSSDYDEKGSASWPHIRLIGDKLDDQLKRMLIDQVLSGNPRELKYIATLSSSCIDSLRRYLLDDDDSEVKTIVKPYLSDSQWLDILVMRGLLTYKILHHCLKKRWSVDYGVDIKTRRRLAAVPFRGMDTPMERTDFGHPDVGLVFTHLSYYYSGLDDGQMMQAFVRLKELAQRDAEYLQWLDASGQDKEWLSEKGIVTDVKAINLDDQNQVCLLIEFFHFNVAAIHFWLNNFVLPKETKQFPSKLVASSWDLARPQSQSMRGFSGTKDSSLLLPIQVELGSLEQLDGTDGDVLDRILRSENRQVLQFTMDVCSGDQIIDFIVSTDSTHPSVLIDVGALVVGMSNRQVAEYWLSQAPEQFKAAAYFDGDQVTVLLRDGHSTPLAFSPLKQCLDKVLIYLDDIHTRGTDFKFPIPSHAVVTLGRDLPKDKLVQAAMRMRQLGHGHSVSFLAPPEIYSQLCTFLEVDQLEPDSSHVLCLALNNTVHQLEKGMMEWAAQGIIFSRREAAFQILTNAMGSSDRSINPTDLKTYLHLVQIPEATRLEEMYGPVQTVAQAVDVVSSMQNRMLNSLSEWSRKEFEEETSASTLILSNILSEIAPLILNRCREFLSMVQVDSRCLDEEQEREIEEEREEEAEREVYRPGPEKAYQPKNFDWLIHLIRSPSEVLRYLEEGEAQPLLEALKQTTVYSLLKESGFDSRIFNSYNFRRTLQDEVAKQQDEFVRPPRWALAVWSGTNVQHLILLSPVEADRAIRELRLQPESPVSLHRFAPRTRRDQSELLISGLTTGYIRPLQSLYFAIPALNLFGSSCCCLPDYFSSIGDICRYLGVVPPPCANSGGLSSSDWRVLVDRKLIQPDGFVDRRAVVRPEGISNKGWATVKQTSVAHQWPISSVTFFRSLVPLRNMEAWFSGSDLSSILLPK